jgi:hypothetical protein
MSDKVRCSLHDHEEKQMPRDQSVVSWTHQGMGDQIISL